MAPIVYALGRVGEVAGAFQGCSARIAGAVDGAAASAGAEIQRRPPKSSSDFLPRAKLPDQFGVIVFQVERNRLTSQAREFINMRPDDGAPMAGLPVVEHGWGTRVMAATDQRRSRTAARRHGMEHLQ
jgi:hypothetical protein